MSPSLLSTPYTSLLEWSRESIRFRFTGSGRNLKNECTVLVFVASTDNRLLHRVKQAQEADWEVQFFHTEGHLMDGLDRASNHHPDLIILDNALVYNAAYMMDWIFREERYRGYLYLVMPDDFEGMWVAYYGRHRYARIRRSAIRSGVFGAQALRRKPTLTERGKARWEMIYLMFRGR